MRRRPPFSPDKLQHRPSGEREFIAELARCQDAQGVTDHVFAARLGVSVALWRQTRAGRTPLGITLLAAGAHLVGQDVLDAAWWALLGRRRKAASGERRKEDSV